MKNNDSKIVSILPIRRLSAGLMTTFVLLLSTGCNLPGLSASFYPTAPVIEPQSETPLTPAIAGESETRPLPGAEAARQTVVDFLTALQLDTNSTLAPQMLSSSLHAQSVQPEGLQATLINTTENIPSFEVSAASLYQTGLQAEIEATLFFDNPINIAFSLIIEDNQWKISGIRPVGPGGEYPPTPEGVVQDFLIAYQERPDDMSGYLSASRRNAQPPGGSVGMLRILGPLEGVLVQSAVVNPDPPLAVISVVIKAGGIESRRQFILNMEADRWGIDEIQIMD